MKAGTGVPRVLQFPGASQGSAQLVAPAMPGCKTEGKRKGAGETEKNHLEKPN